MNTRIIRVRDLTDQLETPHPRPFLICPTCAAEYSANRADYFSVHPDTALKCCGVPSVLVIETRGLQEVSA